MTQQSPAYAIQGSSHGAELFRRAIGTLIGSAGGIVGSGDYAITQNGTPNMSVNVAGGLPGGQVWVPGTSSSAQGPYYAFNDATVNLAIAASNPSNPRIDVPVVQVQDAAYAGAVNSASLSVVTGTAAGSPVAPSVPASSLALANVAVAALATTIVTGNITDKRPRLALASLLFSSLPGYEIGYDPITANVTVTATTRAGATSVISCASHTFDGSPVMAEFFSPAVVVAGPTSGLVEIVLFEGATDLGTLSISTYPNDFPQVPVMAGFRFTPSAGAHTYTVKAYGNSVGNGTIAAGPGGTNQPVPAYVRFTKV